MKFTRRQINHKGWNCADCGRNVIKMGEYYMVRPEIWKRAGMEWEGNLCIACLEKRIGRKLRGLGGDFRKLDFITFPENPGGYPDSDLYSRRANGEKLFAVSKLAHPAKVPRGWRWKKERGRWLATDGCLHIGSA
jgi:hypothetical protein